MPKICDRSPCDELMKALGNYVFGAMNGDAIGGFILRVQDTGAPRHESVTNSFKEIYITYCPFCGTRLEEINATVIRKFTGHHR